MYKKLIFTLAIIIAGLCPALAQNTAQDSIKLARMQAGQNQLEGQKFLKENGRRPEVKTTYTGLQYEVIKIGESKKSPSAYKTVVVNYTAKFTDGQVFDRGENAEFNLQDVIAGFSEGVQYMRVGSHYILYIPPELGYGTRGYGNVPPCKTLIFDVELVGIK